MNDNNILREENKGNDIAKNNSLKNSRKRRKESIEIASAECKSRKLTEDQEDFLNRIGRYAPYRPVRTGVEEEDYES